MRNFRAQDFFDALLMHRVAIGMQQQDRDSLDAARFELARQPTHLLFVERRVNRAVGHHPLIDLVTP